MDLEQLKGFLETNKDNQEIQEVLKGYSKVELSLEGVQKFLGENDEAKRYLDSEKDKHFTKGLETWKQNHLEKLLNDEITKRFPEATEDQKIIAQLKADNERLEREKIRTDLKNKAKDVAADKNLPLELVDFFIGDTEESTLENIKTLEQKWTTSLQKAVDFKLADGGRKPPEGQTKKMTKEEFNQLSYQQKLVVYNEDKALFDELSK